jgi:hypothetical protein
MVIIDDKGDVKQAIVGPYIEGDTFTLKCDVSGGKPFLLDIKPNPTLSFIICVIVYYDPMIEIGGAVLCTCHKLE